MEMKERKASLVKNGTDLTESNLLKRKVVIQIENYLPLLYINNELLVSKSIKLVTTPPKGIVDIKNHLTDIEYLTETGNDRFMYIGTTMSNISGTKVDIYHDDKYKDLIVIPELDLLGSTEPTDVSDGYNFVLKGYAVGYGELSSTFEHIKTMDSDNLSVLTKPKSSISFENNMMVLPGIGVHGSKNNSSIEMMFDGSHNFIDKNNIANNVVTMGDMSSLYDDIKVPMNVVYQDGINSYTAKYVGSKKPETNYSVGFVLDF
jgi:hypothetical protein